MSVRYEIRVQGFLGPALRGAFAGLRCETAARHSTIRGRLSPEQLLAMLTWLDRYGVGLVQVQCQSTEPACTAASTWPAAPRSAERSLATDEAVGTEPHHSEGGQATSGALVPP
jgi:hypothetical protein